MKSELAQRLYGRTDRASTGTIRGTSVGAAVASSLRLTSAFDCVLRALAGEIVGH
ncbi:MAG: hypothetical protein WD011_00810 [Nitriliruptoraceae bacterium]